MNFLRSLLLGCLLLCTHLLHAKTQMQIHDVEFSLNTASFHSCAAVPFKVTITNHGSTQATDVKFTLHSNDITLTPDDLVLSIIPSAITNYYYDASSGVFWLSEPLIPGQTITVIIPVKITCSILSLPTVPEHVNVDFTGSVAGFDSPSQLNVPINLTYNCTISAGPDQSVCPNTTVQLNATGGENYTWSPVNNFPGSNLPNPTDFISTTMLYTVVVTNANGCSGIDQVKITKLPGFFINGGYDHTTCPGFSVTFNAGPAASYSWSPSTGLSNTNTANPSLTVTNSIVYTVTATNAAGCKATDQVIVTALPATSVSAGADKNICTGTSVTLAATGATSYSWSPSGSLSNSEIANPVANPSLTTTYTVTGSSPGLCSSTDQITINVSTVRPLVGAGADQITCNGTPVALRATGAVSYKWTPSATLSNPDIVNPVATPTVNTIYTVMGTAANGCTNTDQIEIKVNPKPTINAGPDVAVCIDGLRVKLEATGATNYKWSGVPAYMESMSTIYVEKIATTTYTVSTTGANGCTGSDEVTVTILSPPSINAGPDQLICEGSSAQLSATGGATYVWTPRTALSDVNIANPIMSALPKSIFSEFKIDRTYTVTATGANGCVGSDQVTITTVNKPYQFAGNDINFCSGSSATLGSTYYVPTRNNIVSRVWSPSLHIVDPTIYRAIATPTNPVTTYTLTVTDDNGCTNTDEMIVYRGETPVVNAGIDRINCDGVTLTATSNIPVNGSILGNWLVWYPNPKTDVVAYTYNPIYVNPQVSTNFEFVQQAMYIGANKYTFACQSRDVVNVNVIPKAELQYSAFDRRLSVVYWTGLPPQGVTATDYTWSYFWYSGGVRHDGVNANCQGRSSCVVSRDVNYTVDIQYTVSPQYGGGSCVRNAGILMSARSAQENVNVRIEESSAETIVVYPVPAENSITIELYSDTSLSEISVSDVFGAEVLRSEAESNKAEVDLSALPSGIYVLKVTDSKGSVHVKRVEVKK